MALCPCLPGAVLVFALLLIVSLLLSKCSMLRSSLDLWLMESSDPGPTCNCDPMGEGLNKGAVAPAHSSVPREGCPAPCPSRPHPASSQFRSWPSVPGAFQAAAPALELKASESASKPTHGRAPGEECPGPQQPPPSVGCNPGWSSQPGVTGTLLPGPGVLGWGAQCGAGTLGSSWGLLKPKYPLHFLTTTCEWETNPFLISALPPSLHVASL